MSLTVAELHTLRSQIIDQAHTLRARQQKLQAQGDVRDAGVSRRLSRVLEDVGERLNECEQVLQMIEEAIQDAKLDDLLNRVEADLAVAHIDLEQARSQLGRGGDVPF